MNRVIPGIVLAACWLVLLWKGSILLFVLVLVPGLAIGGYEYARMSQCDISSVKALFLSFLSILPVLSIFLMPQFGIAGGLCCAFLLLAFFTLIKYEEGLDSYGFISRASFGIVYVGFLGAYLLLIRTLPAGNYWLLILTGITAGSDSGAYYSGRLFGKHKLSRLISPNKTIEGAVGGLISGMLVASLFALFFLETISWGFLIPVAILLGGIGICGDLTESIIKRATNTKDSGSILGGHGGILDRADSILFAAPVLYYLLRISGTL